MLVLHDNPTSDSSVLPLTDNITFLAESTWSVTSPSTLLTNLVHSSVASANETSTWGPIRDPLYIVVPITVIYVVILLTGLVGNVSTCVVIARNKHMHTATNYYLFSLAVSDLLLLVSGLPQEMYCIWSRYPYVFGEAFCVLQGFAAETSANATVLTITAFTVERYVAICHPFQSHTLSKLSRAVRLVLVIWLLALGLAVPQALQFGVVYEELPDGQVLADHTVCAMKRVVIPHSFEISTLVFFVAPMTLISVLYALIGLQLRRGGSSVRLKTAVGGCRHTDRHTPADGRKNFAKNAQIKATKHVVKMLVAVVVAFFICWAPFHAQRLLAVYGAGSTDDRPSDAMVTVYHTLTYTSGVLYYMSTTVNPVLYHIMSHKFREAFKETLARYLGRRRARGGRWRCYTVLSARHSNTSNASNCAAGSLRRYLEADMARMHESRRPVVVSFRRRRTVQQDSAGDTEVSGASSSTGPDIYVSMEELTKDRSGFNCRKTSKLNKTRNKLNETYISVICRHSKPISRGVRCKSAKEGSEKEDRYAGLRSSSNSSFARTLKHENQAESLEVPAWYRNRSVSCLPTDGIKVPKEYLVIDDIRENVTGDDNGHSGLCNQSRKYPKVEDIEIFQEECFKIQSSFKKRQRTCRRSRHHARKHKTQTPSSNGSECSFKESADKLNFRFDAVQSDTANTTKGPSHCTVPRSSTLPSLPTVTTDSDTHAVGLSVPSLKHTQLFETWCDTLNHNLADEGCKVRLKTRFSRSETHREYLNFGILGCNNISKSESNIKNVIASPREANPNLREARSKLDDVSDHGVKNTVTNWTKSSLATESRLLSQEGKNDIIQLSLPEFPLLQKEVSDKNSGHHIHSETEEEQKSPKESHPSLSPQDNTLTLQKSSLNSVEGHNTQNSNPSSGENSVTLQEFRQYMANTGVRESSDSTSLCNSRPKSCSDLTLSVCTSARQNYESRTSPAYASSPRLTACDLAV